MAINPTCKRGALLTVPACRFASTPTPVLVPCAREDSTTPPFAVFSRIKDHIALL